MTDAYRTYDAAGRRPTRGRCLRVSNRGRESMGAANVGGSLLFVGGWAWNGGDAAASSPFSTCSLRTRRSAPTTATLPGAAYLFIDWMGRCRGARRHGAPRGRCGALGVAQRHLLLVGPPQRARRARKRRRRGARRARGAQWRRGLDGAAGDVGCSRAASTRTSPRRSTATTRSRPAGARRPRPPCTRAAQSSPRAAPCSSPAATCTTRTGRTPTAAIDIFSVA